MEIVRAFSLAFVNGIYKEILALRYKKSPTVGLRMAL